LLDELPLAAGALLGASIAVKYVSIITVPFFLILLWHAHKQRIRAVSTTIVGMSAVIIASFTPFWFGFKTLQPIVGNQTDASSSPTALLTDIYLAFSRKEDSDLVFSGQLHWHILRHAGAGIFINLSLIGLWMILTTVLSYRFARTRNLWLAYLAGTSFFAAIPAIAPYYLIWLSPLLAERSRWGRVIWLLLAVPILYYTQSLMGNLNKEEVSHIYAVALLLVPLAATFIRPAASK
jgi:hypothetical protein